MNIPKDNKLHNLQKQINHLNFKLIRAKECYRNRLYELGAKRVSQERTKQLRWEALELRFVKELREKGMTWKAIAQDLKLSNHHLKKVKRKLWQEVNRPSQVASPDEKLTLESSAFKLNLPVRVANCLNNGNLLTLADIMCKTQSEMVHYRNFGLQSFYTLQHELKRHGFKWPVEKSAEA